MADREAKASGKTAPIGLSWGGASSNGGSGSLGREPDLKAVFGSVASKMPAPPPAGGLSRPPAESKDAVDLLFSGATPEQAPAPAPATIGAPAAESDELDPMASLFSGGGAVPAPKLDPQSPSQRPPPPEKRKWQGPAGTRTSLYDDHVRDPIPAPKSAPPPVPAPAVIGALELKSVPRAQPSTATEAIASQRPRALTPPPPPPQAKPSRKPEASAVQSAAEEASEDKREQPAQARKRRVERGPSTLLLSLLTLAALLVLGVASVLLGLVENPFAKDPTPAAAPKLGAAVPTASLPPAAQPAALAKLPEPAKPASVAAPTATPANEPKPAQPLSEPKTVPPPAPAPVKPEPSAAVAEPEKPAPPAATQRDRASEAANNDEAASALLGAARKKLADDDAKGAELLLRQALAQDPQDHHAMELMARALMEQDRGKDALVYAKKIVQRRPRRVSYRLLLGDLLLMVGNEPGARAEWQEALKLEPNDPQIKRRLGQ